MFLPSQSSLSTVLLKEAEQYIIISKMTQTKQELKKHKTCALIKSKRISTLNVCVLGDTRGMFPNGKPLDVL